jgi:hypothetical protein
MIASTALEKEKPSELIKVPGVINQGASTYLYIHGYLCLIGRNLKDCANLMFDDGNEICN